MILKTTFTVGLAVAAMAFSVQAAAAQPMSDASDRAQQATVSSYPDAIERAVLARENAGRSVSVYPDAIERAAAAAGDTTSGPLVGHVDRYELDLPNAPVTATTSTGRDIEWPQLGLGFGIGIVVVLGLIFAVRFSRGRPLVHG